jgi:plasmid stabilization system protein ParE
VSELARGETARLVLSDAAVADILEQADWYIAQSGQALAERWEKAITSAVLRVVKNPSAGAPCRFRRRADTSAAAHHHHSVIPSGVEEPSDFAQGRLGPTFFLLRADG